MDDFLQLVFGFQSVQRLLAAVQKLTPGIGIDKRIFVSGAQALIAFRGLILSGVVANENINFFAASTGDTLTESTAPVLFFQTEFMDVFG